MNAALIRSERWLWYLFLVSAAWQIRGIVWQADTVFIEWRSAAIYFSDLCMLGLLLFGAIHARWERSWTVMRANTLLVALVLASVVSLVHAPARIVGVLGIVRLLQYILFFWYLRYRARRVMDPDLSALAFVVGACGQAALGIGQFVAQHDLGFRWIGETILQTNMHGVAVFLTDTGDKVLRAYGTFPHPNILAAYLMTALWLMVWLQLRHAPHNLAARALWLSVFALLLVGMYLTFSRTIISVWWLSALIACAALWSTRVSNGWHAITSLRQRARALVGVTIVATLAFGVLLWPLVMARLTIASSDEAVQLRIRYTRDALHSGTSFLASVNWTGVGIGNFTSWLAGYDRSLPSYLVQPAHNIYALVYTELGAVGLVILVAWLVGILRSLWKNTATEPVLRVGLCLLVGSLMLIGSLDHFYWTLQQGRILWWMTLALAASTVER